MLQNSSLLLVFSLLAVANGVKMKEAPEAVSVEEPVPTLEEMEHEIEGALYQVNQALAEADMSEEQRRARTAVGVRVNPYDYQKEVDYRTALKMETACALVEDNYWLAQNPPRYWNDNQEEKMGPDSGGRQASQRKDHKADVKSNCLKETSKGCVWCVTDKNPNAIAKDEGECLESLSCTCAKEDDDETACEAADPGCKWITISVGAFSSSGCIDQLEAGAQYGVSCKNPAPGSDTAKMCNMWSFLLDWFGGTVGQVLFKIAETSTKALISVVVKIAPTEKLGKDATALILRFMQF
jgi:hypothetical protein